MNFYYTTLVQTGENCVSQFFYKFQYFIHQYSANSVNTENSLVAEMYIRMSPITLVGI